MLPTASTHRTVRAGVVAAMVLAWATAALAAGAPAALAAGASDPAAARDQARQILDATGVTGGLVIHLGCGDGRLTAALGEAETFVVYGLDTGAADVEAARAHVRALGRYGRIAISCFDGSRLPFVDNLANLVVAEDLGGVAADDAMRVLAPGGTLYIRKGGGWQKTVKPKPGNTDEWTHYLHDASGNAVAHDDAVGPPRRVQWLADPRHARSHEHTPTINAVVSAGGRLFYIADEGATISLRRLPEWHLVARDAYNGLALWKRPFNPWYPHIMNWGGTPEHLQRRLVAAGDRLYVTLGLHAPLSAVDAATGETIKVYEQTEGTEEVLWHKGILLLAVRSVTGERVAQLEEWQGLVRKDKSPVYVRESADPIVQQFRSTDAKAPAAILALDADTGRVLWKKTGDETAGLRSCTLCAAGDRVLYQRRDEVVCLDLATGREQWSASAPELWLVADDKAVCADGQTVTALAVATGKPLWSQPTTLCQIRDVFVAGGALWEGGFKPFQGRATGKRGPPWGPYFATQRDLATGKMLKQVEPENPSHHHRCWRNKATDRYILGGRRGVEFIDLASGDVLWNSWVRGVCRYGVMPANGLLYAPPHACGCYITAKLTGFYALATDPAKRETAADGGGRPAVDPLQKGPAYAPIANPKSKIESDAWPTYRHDAQRSGATPSPVPAALKPLWTADVGGALTAPTVAGGKVFVASVDDHRVAALDAASGRTAWTFTAGGRVDSPPTLADGRALFGCRDGCVYSVRADDGALAWRRRAAREERLITALGQVESASPVAGSVLVTDGTVVATAGRSSYLDGGIDLVRLEAGTGRALSATPIYSPDPETGRQPDQFGPCAMPGALADILSADGEHIYLRDMVYSREGAPQAKGNPHLLTLTGFLDGTWPHRSYWIFGTECSLATGCSSRDKNLVYGRVLAFDGSTVYGYGRANIHWSNQLEDGAYRLFAVARGESKPAWTKTVPITVRAMVLAGKVLFLAGPDARAVTSPEGPGDKPEATLLAVSTADGSEVGRCRLPAPPVFDGMAAAGGRLLIALENGRLVCLGE